MARSPREDVPGMWHHVFHRGIARRTVFETRRDMRYFLAQVARAVRRGEIEVHAFCMLNNHFHMLLWSARGNLSWALRRILNVYVRYFNRTRGRDGALFSGRFRSKPVKTRAYRRAVVRYIDHNPVEAGLADRAEAYEWGSARWHTSRRGPIWLARDWIETEVDGHTGRPAAPTDYWSCFKREPSETIRDWVSGRLHSPHTDEEHDDLLARSPAGLRAWMIERARRADGTRPGASHLPAALVHPLLRIWLVKLPLWKTVRSNGARVDAGELALPGLLRELCGLTERETSARLGLPRTTVQRRLDAHRAALLADRAYSEECARIAHAAFAELRRQL